MKKPQTIYVRGESLGSRRTRQVQLRRETDVLAEMTREELVLFVQRKVQAKMKGKKA